MVLLRLLHQPLRLGRSLSSVGDRAMKVLLAEVLELPHRKSDNAKGRLEAVLRRDLIARIVVDSQPYGLTPSRRVDVTDEVVENASNTCRKRLGVLMDHHFPFGRRGSRLIRSLCLWPTPHRQSLSEARRLPVP